MVDFLLFKVGVYLIVNKHQLNNIIEKKLSKNEFKPKRDLLEADAIAPIKARIAPYIH
tara:strand:+ start:807 stop:980 length:174 start_codon:yes stop_codon:yes gene_type:complete